MSQECALQKLASCVLRQLQSEKTEEREGGKRTYSTSIARYSNTNSRNDPEPRLFDAMIESLSLEKAVQMAVKLTL